MTVILEQFVSVKEAVSTDERGRIALGPTEKSATFSIARNGLGQILLTPITAVPTHELWLHQNPAALSTVMRGLAEAEAGLGKPVDYSAFANMDTETED